MAEQKLQSTDLKIETIPFDGGVIQAGRVGGEVVVPLKSMCETLGIGYKAQHERITDVTRSPWATVRIFRMDAADGKNREVTCIDLRTIPMWLATLTSGKVKAALRPKIVKYQIECADVLYAYFFPPAPPATTTPVVVDPLRGVVSVIQHISVALDQFYTRQVALEAQQKDLTARQDDLARDVAAAQDRIANNEQYLDNTCGALHLLNDWMVGSDNQLQALAARVSKVSSEAVTASLAVLASVRATGDRHGYYTVTAYANIMGLNLDAAAAIACGKRLSGLCRERGAVIRSEPDARYGSVNAYPLAIFLEHFKQTEAEFNARVSIRAQSSS